MPDAFDEPLPENMMSEFEERRLEDTIMLELHKQYIFDDNQQPIAVQIPIAEFEQIEEILENFGLAKLMKATEDDEQLSKTEALKYYQSLKSKHVGS